MGQKNTEKEDYRSHEVDREPVRLLTQSIWGGGREGLHSGNRFLWIYFIDIKGFLGIEKLTNIAGFRIVKIPSKTLLLQMDGDRDFVFCGPGKSAWRKIWDSMWE